MNSHARLGRWFLYPPICEHSAILLLRLMAGSVFIWEGVLKFIYPSLGAVRFRLLGFPLPHLTASLVGLWEIVGGVLLAGGLLTRIAAVPFVIEMVVAILSTKVGMYRGTSPLPLPPVPPQVGLGAVLHDGRSDLAQLLTSLFLAITGPGQWSLDAMLQRRRTPDIGSPARPTLHNRRRKSSLSARFASAGDAMGRCSFRDAGRT